MRQYDDQIKATFGNQYSSVCHPTSIKESVLDLEPCDNKWTLPIRTQEELTAITGKKRGIKKHMDNWFKWRKATIHSDSFDKRQKNQDRLKEIEDKHTEQQRASKAKIEALNAYIEQLKAEEAMSPEQLQAKREAELQQQQYQAQRAYDSRNDINKLLMISEAHAEFSNNVDIGSTIKVHASWIPNYYEGSCPLKLKVLHEVKLP